MFRSSSSAGGRGGGRIDLFFGKARGGGIAAHDGFALLLLMVALFGGVFLLALIGAALIWFPVLLVFAVMAAIAGLIRRL